MYMDYYITVRFRSLCSLFLGFWLIYCIEGNDDRREENNQENESATDDNDDDDDHYNFHWEFDQQLATSHQVVLCIYEIIAHLPFKTVS